MRLLADLQQERQMGLILITHDLGVVADVADRIAVMYAGRIVEQADVFEIYARPAHPYTKGLLESIPRLDQKGLQLAAIGGLPPNLMRIPPGCPFNPAATTPRTSAVPTRRRRCGGVWPDGSLPLLRVGARAQPRAGSHPDRRRRTSGPGVRAGAGGGLRTGPRR